MAANLILSVFLGSCSSGKQVIAEFSQEEIGQAITNDNWIFSASNAMPSFGRTRSLTFGYDVTLYKYTITVSLPYYGKLNSPSGANNANPLEFKSTNVNLSKEDKKGGGKMVTIKRNNPEIQNMIFTFFNTGSAQLIIILTNRSGISFSGQVTPLKR